MNHLKTILVAVDFSTGSRAALDQAARIAGLNGAKLHVLHVMDSAAVMALADAHEESFERRAKQSAEGAGAALVRWMEHSTVPAGCEVTIATGVPLHEILEHAKKFKADLLVAGIAGAGNRPAGAGSVSGKLARKAAMMVLLVRADHPHAFKKVVACIDFSETAREVAAQAHRVAVQDGACVDFLNVWQDPMLSMPYVAPMAEAGTPMFSSTPEFRKEYVENIQLSLKEFVSDVAQGIESAQVLLESGNYGSGIAIHAEAAKADLIVIGGKGRTNLRYVLLGSTAERLLTLLPCSVLVVRLPAG
jgi:nucleotide-binding universal stress UspA family protein